MVIRKLILFLAAGSCSVIFGSSIGTNQTTCPVGSLASYEALASTGCMVSGVTFNNFSLLAAYSNGVTPTPASGDILISPNPAVAGLDFAYPVTTRNYVSFALQYEFDPPPATGGTLHLDVLGDVDVFESICPGGTFSNAPHGCFGRPSDTSPVNLEVFNEHLGGTKLTDSEPINPPATKGAIQVYFVLNGLPNDPAGFDKLTSGLTPGVPVGAVPEPKAIGLLLIGLALVCGIQVFAFRHRKA